MGFVSSPLRILALSLLVLILAVILILLGIDRGSSRMLGFGIAALCLSATGFLVGAQLGRTRDDPLERRREQRLWKSGPLGRRWLEWRRKHR